MFVVFEGGLLKIFPIFSEMGGLQIKKIPKAMRGVGGVLIIFILKSEFGN